MKKQMTQEQLYYSVAHKQAEKTAFIIDMIKGVYGDPLTAGELRRLIEKYPEKFGEYAPLVKYCKQ